MRLEAMMALMLLGGMSASAQKPETDVLLDAQQLYDSGKYSDAEKSFTEVTREHPDNVAAQMYLGQKFFKEEKFEWGVGGGRGT